jgi:regulator of sirC expression with transglutaminase-like and TPR domain
MEVAMNTRVANLAWSDLAQLADDAIPLLDTALLIARDEYPDLDTEACREQMAAHVRAISASLPEDRTLAQSLQAINRHLFEESGFAGNHDDYFDPRNSSTWTAFPFPVIFWCGWQCRMA